MIGKIRQYLIDSYRGLYKIVIEPSMPTKQTVILLIVGLLIGMAWAYVLAPVVYYDGTPNELRQADQDQWVRMVAASYASGMYDEATVVGLLQRIDSPAETVQRLLSTAPEGSVEQRNLQSIVDPANSASPGTSAPQDAGLLSSILTFIVAILVVMIVTPIFVVVWRLLIYPNIVAPLWDKIRPKSEEEKARIQKAAIDRQARLEEIEAKKSMAAMVDQELGEPLIQKLSIYTKGRQYDESFAIETADDEFLGECGATISKTIGATNEVAAVEIWLFDKDDFVRTLTKVFVSEAGYNDPAIRSDLETKVDDPINDIVMVQPGASLQLNTDGLRVQATIKSFEYGSAPDLPPNSHFNKLNIEIAAWQKKTAGVPGVTRPVSAPAPVMAAPVQSAPAQTTMSPPPAYNPPPAPVGPPPTYSPPPQQAAPASPGIRPLTPPPLQRPQKPEEDDDPFGGTGDFTPISNT